MSLCRGREMDSGMGSVMDATSSAIESLDLPGERNPPGPSVAVISPCCDHDLQTERAALIVGTSGVVAPVWKPENDSGDVRLPTRLRHRCDGSPSNRRLADDRNAARHQLHDGLPDLVVDGIDGIATVIDGGSTTPTRHRRRGRLPTLSRLSPEGAASVRPESPPPGRGCEEYDQSAEPATRVSTRTGIVKSRW